MTLVSMAVLIASVVNAAEFPPGYWDREFGYGTSQAVTISVSIRVPDMQKAESAANERLIKSGAKASGSSGSFIRNAPQAGQRATRSLSYSVDVAKADKAARTLLDMGDLQSYSRQRHITAAMIRDVQERIKALRAEMTENAEQLKRMPIAAHFLNSKLARMTQAEDAYRQSLKQAAINLTLIEGDDSGE